MSSEIIQCVACDNYDDFQHVNLIFSQNCKNYPHICSSSYSFIGGVAKKREAKLRHLILLSRVTY